MENVFRKAKLDDLAAFMSLIEENFGGEYVEKCKLEFKAMTENVAFKPVFFVIERESEVVATGGFAQSFLDYSVFEIMWICVRKSLQGHGLGKLFMKNLLNEIKLANTEGKSQVVTLSAKIPEYYHKFGFETYVVNDECHLMGLII